jgi:hypothetical protein
MSALSTALRVGADSRAPGRPATTGVRAYFASDTARALQTVLGLVWLLDGGLQFQSFMYSKGFIALLTGLAAGQPSWLHDSLIWGAGIANGNLTLWNTLFAITQIALGLGILYRPTVRPALALSVVWALIVWWFGEAFGMVFMMMALPLTGAPGAVSLYALIALIVWPNGRPGGLTGVRGARIAWGVLWGVMAWLWLEPPSAATNALSNAINAAPSGMSWLSTVQDWAANGAKGNGVWIAIVLALLSLAIGIAVGVNWRPRPFLIAAIVLNLVLWVVGQGFGGIAAGGATDPNAGLLFVVLAATLWMLVGKETDGRPVAAPAGATAPAPWPAEPAPVLPAAAGPTPVPTAAAEPAPVLPAAAGRAPVPTAAAEPAPVPDPPPAARPVAPAPVLTAAPPPAPVPAPALIPPASAPAVAPALHGPLGQVPRGVRYGAPVVAVAILGAIRAASGRRGTR